MLLPCSIIANNQQLFFDLLIIWITVVKNIPLIVMSINMFSLFL